MPRVDMWTPFVAYDIAKGIFGSEKTKVQKAH